MPAPVLLVGDHPTAPSGLARILRDLVTHVIAPAGHEVAQVGWAPADGPEWQDWPVYRISSDPMAQDWGVEHVWHAWSQFFGTRRGILFSVWDPARCWPLTQLDLPVARWGYFAIDGANARGTMGGPAGEAIHRYDRVLAYTRWGSTILRPLRREPVSYLPHGLTVREWAPPAHTHAPTVEWFDHFDPSVAVIGVVATNQPRKDWATACAAVAELRRRRWSVCLWAHIDRDVAAWSLPELIDQYDLRHQVVVTHQATDAELAAAYRRCAVTFGPGLGEGFGYPLVESLAAGTPVVHVDTAGGAELVPCAAWKVPVRASRTESVYNIRRPVLDPIDVANALERVLRWRQDMPPIAVQAYCVGSVAHLDWQVLSLRWSQWWRRGLGVC